LPMKGFRKKVLFNNQFSGAHISSLERENINVGKSAVSNGMYERFKKVGNNGVKLLDKANREGENLCSVSKEFKHS